MNLFHCELESDCTLKNFNWLCFHGRGVLPWSDCNIQGRVCFLWVTAKFFAHGSNGSQHNSSLVVGCVSFPRIERSTSQPSYSPYISPFSQLSLHHNQQWLLGVGMITVLVLSCGVSKIQSSRTIFQFKVRDISNPCVKLEATHPCKRCSGQDVHTMNFAWCKSTRDGTTPVIASGSAHKHG
jgi:hypothetical protein